MTTTDAQNMEPKRRRKPVAREIIMARAAKAAATKLSKRITKVCPVCGKEWKEKPSHVWRVHCSARCAGNNLKHPKTNDCVQCGNKFDTTWRTRKQITCSTQCLSKWKSKLHKESGNSRIRNRNYSKWLAVMQSEDNRLKMKVLNTGKIRTTPKSKRYSPQHIRAVECFLRSPSNVVYYIKNITKFVHDKPELFPPDTLRWVKGKRSGASISCNATHGLAGVARGHRMTWRGWTVVSGREGRERYDLIGRNLIVDMGRNISGGLP